MRGGARIWCKAPLLATTAQGLVCLLPLPDPPPSTEHQVHPQPSSPSWGVEGPHITAHTLELTAAFPPLTHSQPGLTKPQAQIRAQSEPVLLTGWLGGWACRVVGSLGGGCWQHSGPVISSLLPPPISPFEIYPTYQRCELSSFRREGCYAFVSSRCLPPQLREDYVWG